MVSLVDEALRSSRFNQHSGLASPAVTIADPATGTGTFPLGILRRVAKNVQSDQGEGAVPDAIYDTLKKIIAFEVQLGPFAVAQLRLLAEVLTLTGSAVTAPLRMFVTDTLGDPDDEEGQIAGRIPRSIAKSRRDANRIKRDETITVVIGNPPYKEKAKGKGGWVEGQTAALAATAPLRAWQAPASWGTGAHAKHLRNLYILLALGYVEGLRSQPVPARLRPAGRHSVLHHNRGLSQRPRIREDARLPSPHL